MSSVSKVFVKKRLENNNIFFEDPYKSYYTNSLLNIYWFESFYNKNDKSVRQKNLSDIFFLDLIFSIKGLKHLFSYPIHGQRTWSNSKTPKKLNTILIDYKINFFKNQLFGSINLSNLKQIIYLNYFNWVWHIFWIKDWVFLYKKNKNLLLKNQFSKKKTLTLHKILNSKPQKKKSKIKEGINLKNIFDFIGLDDLILLYKK